MARGGCVQVREYTPDTVAEMQRHAVEVRARLFAGRLPRKPEPPMSVHGSIVAGDLSSRELVDPGHAKPAERPVDAFVDRALAEHGISYLRISPLLQEKGATYRGHECVAIVQGVSGIALSDLRGPSRVTSISKARQIGFWLVVTYAKASYPAAGRYFGHRDHTTALHGVAKVKRAMRDLGLEASEDASATAERLWNAEWPEDVSSRQRAAASRARARR